jgi:diguanylate cyclase (GGDEF)-like protein/PAS domain S-box-containing protein
MPPEARPPQPLRVLILEDNSADAELVVRRLRQAGFDVDAQRVETEADYRGQLDTRPQLILADYALPQYDALHALQHLQARQLDIPFIIVTGMTGEEAAVACMRQGAADYLLKDRLARLGPAVAHALEQKRLRDEARQAEADLRESEERYRTLAEAAQDMIYTIGRDGRLRYVNNIAAQQVGVERDQLVGQSSERLLAAEDLENQRRILQDVLETGQPAITEHRVSFQGRNAWLSTWLAPLRNAGGEVIAAMGYSRDITQRKRAEAIQAVVYKISQAANTVTNLDDLYRSIHAGLGELIRTDNFYIALFDAEHEELTFPYWVDQKDPHPPPQKPGRGLTEYVLRTGCPQLVSPERYIELQSLGETNPEHNGSPSVDWVGVPLRVEDRLIGVMAVQSYTEALRIGQEETDILSFVSTQVAMAIERKRAEEAIRRLATTDTLTGLHNRHHFLELAQREFERARRYVRPLSIIMLDIDNLKPVNDAEGHFAGDFLIRAVGQECVAQLRKSDLLGRYGGDEFVALLPETELVEALQVIDRLREHTACRTFVYEGRSLQTSISVGVAALDPDCTGMETLLGRADRALYAAKQAGKNRLSVWGQ